MRHASKLAHLHAFSCMDEECMHDSGRSGKAEKIWRTIYLLGLYVFMIL